MTYTELKFIAVGDPSHFVGLISASLVRRGILLPKPAVLASMIDELMAHLVAWSAERHGQFTWARNAGRTSKGREYRIAYQAPNITELLLQLDAEIVRLLSANA